MATVHIYLTPERKAALRALAEALGYLKDGRGSISALLAAIADGKVNVSAASERQGE